MIFITLGSQKFQFNRLLEEVDRLIEKGVVIEEVFAQIGYSNYKPRNYRYKKFLDRDEFLCIMEETTKVITHGGTGAIITAVKNKKKVVAVPRLSKFDEHVDDHQLQIVEEFEKMGFIKKIDEIDQLGDAISKLKGEEFKEYISSTENIILEIQHFINSI